MCCPFHASFLLCSNCSEARRRRASAASPQGTTVFPMGKSASSASLMCCQAKGMPMMVKARAAAVATWERAIHTPARRNHMTLPITPGMPVPISFFPYRRSRGTASYPKGMKANPAMTKHARPQGRPMMLTHASIPARSHSSAMNQPPNMIQSMLPMTLMNLPFFLLAAIAGRRKGRSIAGRTGAGKGQKRGMTRSEYFLVFWTADAGTGACRRR